MDPISVFLVDDDDLFLKSLEHYLLHTLKLHIQIRSFKTAEECISQLDEETSIIVLDYLLNTTNPKAMNGLMALREIKSLFPMTKVIILSGHEDMTLAIETIKYGAYDYVVKNENTFIKIRQLLKNTLQVKNNKMKLTPNITVAVSVFGLIIIALFILVEYLKKT